MNSNSDNPRIGKAFEKAVKKWAVDYYDCGFNEEQPVDIGNPARPHKFDLVSQDSKIIIECKCYTWTDGGNVPSAKLATLDEAVLYLRSVTSSATKVIAMKKDYNKKKGITLADYFCDKKGHLLEDIKVVEFDEEGKSCFARK